MNCTSGATLHNCLRASSAKSPRWLALLVQGRASSQLRIAPWQAAGARVGSTTDMLRLLNQSDVVHAFHENFHCRQDFCRSIRTTLGPESSHSCRSVVSLRSLLSSQKQLVLLHQLFRTAKLDMKWHM